MKYICLIFIIISSAISNVQIALSSQIKTKGINWPKTPFMPHLIHVAPNSESLCRSYEIEARRQYFKGFYKSDQPLVGIEKAVTIKPIKLAQVPGFSGAYKYTEVFHGDLNGDGQKEYTLAIRSGGGNVTNYHYYFKFLTLDDQQLSNFLIIKEEKASPSNPRDSYLIHRAFLDEINKRKEKNQPREHPTETRILGAVSYAYQLHPTKTRISGAASYAYQLFDNFIMREFNNRLYIDVSTPLTILSEKVLLSYDIDMRPKAECIMALKPQKNYLLNNPYQIGSLHHIINASSQMIGSETNCHRGSSKAMPHLKQSQRLLINESLFRPWGIEQTNILLSERFSEKIIGDQGHWKGQGYQYSWSLRSSYKRSIYDKFQHHTTKAIEQLATYYHKKYHVEKKIALNWAGRYLFKIRWLSSRGGGVLALDRTKKIWSIKDHDLMNSIDKVNDLKNLIKSGSDVNQPNGFGKTALMMSAHLNQIESVKLLLKLGANPNLKTWLKMPLDEKHRWNNYNGEGCYYSTIKFRGRTALMYAAENASFQIFQILIEAGSDITAVDSKKRTIKDYLAKNDKMSPKEIKEVQIILSSKPN